MWTTVLAAVVTFASPMQFVEIVRSEPVAATYLTPRVLRADEAHDAPAEQAIVLQWSDVILAGLSELASPPPMLSGRQPKPRPHPDRAFG